jgi:hypothetical protein
VKVYITQIGDAVMVLDVRQFCITNCLIDQEGNSNRKMLSSLELENLLQLKTLVMVNIADVDQGNQFQIMLEA